MPRYFFDVRDGDGTFVDDLGVVLPDMETAKREARKALSDMVRDALRQDAAEALSIAIRDGMDGPVVLTVTMTTQMPPRRA